MDKTFDNLKYGDIVYCKAIGKKKRGPHFTVVISNSCTKAQSKSSRLDPIHHGITFSKRPTENGCIAIENDKLPKELVEHWGLNVNELGVSYFRYLEPVNFAEKDVDKICKEDVSTLQEINSSVCELLCSDIYIFHNMLKNERKYGGIVFEIGELCCCTNFGCNDANTVRMCGPDNIFNQCPHPETIDGHEIELSEEEDCLLTYLTCAISRYDLLIDTIKKPNNKDEFVIAQNEIKYLIEEARYSNNRLEELDNYQGCPLIICPEDEQYVYGKYEVVYN